jgi:hypothetical protein
MSDGPAGVDWRLYRGFEGGAVYTGEHEGKFLVLTEEGTLADLLPPEDLEGLQLRRVKAFDSEAARQAYLMKRYPPRP